MIHIEMMLLLLLLGDIMSVTSVLGECQARPVCYAGRASKKDWNLRAGSNFFGPYTLEHSDSEKNIPIRFSETNLFFRFDSAHRCHIGV